MTATLPRVFELALLMLACVAAGCGGEPIGQVQGKVTFEGQPVSEGMLIFQNPEKGVHITAPLAADGTYALQTAGGFGLPLGDYGVAVTPPIVEPWMPGMPGEPPKPKNYDNIPLKYRRRDTSGLALTVVKGDNPFNIEMHADP